MASSPTIATHRVDVADLPEGQQFAAWAATVANSTVARLSDGPFLARAAFWRLDPLLVSEQWLDPVSFDRDARRIRSDKSDHYSLVVMRSGECAFPKLRGDHTVCGPGEALIMDLGRPALVHATRQHSIAIQVPRWFLDEALPPVAIHGPLPRTAATSLLVDYVTDLVARAPDLPEGGEALLARTVRDLLAVALAGLPPRAALSPGATAGRQRVRAYMETCPMGALDIDAMCRALGLTRSSLYRMFSRDGGVLAYDRRRRLVALHRRLADPQEHASLAELGFAHGFPGRTHLSQVFRETFGYTASELRSHALGQAPNRPLTGSAQDLYRQALRSLA